MLKSPIILFFVNDCVPSEQQILESQGYGTRVSFRNALFVPAPVFKKGKDGEELANANFLEKCDGVAGDVPALYKDYPIAEDVIDKFEAERKKLLAAAKAHGKKKTTAKKAKVEPKVEAKPAEAKPADWKPNS